MSDSNSNNNESKPVRRRKYKSTTYGGDGKVLSEYTTENESNSVITSADGSRILG